MLLLPKESLTRSFEMTIRFADFNLILVRTPAPCISSCVLRSHPIRVLPISLKPRRRAEVGDVLNQICTSLRDAGCRAVHFRSVADRLEEVEADRSSWSRLLHTITV